MAKEKEKKVIEIPLIVKEGNKTSNYVYKYDYLTDCTGDHFNVTSELDSLKKKELDIDIHDLYKIALWKTNRFPIVPNEVLDAMNRLKRFDTQDVMSDEWKKETKKVIEMLLDEDKVRGVGLPMASTFLRFLNPNAYQIIDVRAFRMAFDFKPERYDSNNKCFPALGTAGFDVYVKYIEKLKTIATEGYHGIKVAFQDLDRFLYDVDKAFKNELKAGKKPSDEWKKVLKLEAEKKKAALIINQLELSKKVIIEKV